MMGNCANSFNPYIDASLPRNENINMTPIKNQHLMIIIIYGGPCIGKATQSRLIAKKYNLNQLSCSELLRDEVSIGNQRGVTIAKIMREGYLVPAGVVLDLIKERMLATFKNVRGFVIDGFPREKLQAVRFDEEIVPADLVVHLITNDALLRDRCQGRAVTSGRRNETIKMIERRIKCYRKKRSAIVKYYKDKLIEIDGARDIESVFNVVCYEVDEIIEKLE